MLDPGYSKLLQSLKLVEAEVEQQSEVDIEGALGISDVYHAEIVPGATDDKHANTDHTDSMNDTADYRHELQLRDEQLRRDMAAQRELTDERMRGLDERVKAFMDNQVERDKRIEDIAARATKAAESAATVKSNYWAAVGVQLLAVAAILVGAYFATQANTLSAIATTLSAYEAGRAEPSPSESSPAASGPPRTSAPVAPATK